MVCLILSWKFYLKTFIKLAKVCQKITGGLEKIKNYKNTSNISHDYLILIGWYGNKEKKSRSFSKCNQWRNIRFYIPNGYCSFRLFILINVDVIKIRYIFLKRRFQVLLINLKLQSNPRHLLSINPKNSVKYTSISQSARLIMKEEGLRVYIY